MRIGPNQILDNGTKVKVGNKLGIITGHEVVQAIPCGMITVHEVTFHSKIIKVFGNVTKQVSITPKKQKVNYSFIEVQ